MSGQLGSEKMTDGSRIKRHIAGHRLSWNPNKNIILVFGEQIIYTGVNRGFELIYFNPFVPYFFTGLEGDEETEPEDNDNSILFAYGRYKLNSDLSILTPGLIVEEIVNFLKYVPFIDVGLALRIASIQTLIFSINF